MRRDVEKFVQKCPVCTATNIRGSIGTTNSKTISYSTEPTECWHLDFIGPLPKSRRGGNRYVLVAIDEASGYIESKAMPDCTTNGLRQAIRELINRWGIPRILRSDNGTVFTSDSWKQFATKEMGIELQYSPIYHPQSNGRVERANRTIKSTLVKQCAASNTAIDWFDVLTTTMHALNTSASVALGGEKSPFEIMHGRKARSILDIKWNEKDQPERELDEWIWRTRETIEIAIKAMKTERKKAENKRMELNNNNNKRINSYKKGDRVLVKDLEPKTLEKKLVTEGNNNPFQSTQSNWKKGIILMQRGDGLVFDIELDRSNAKRRIRKQIIQVHADHLQFDNTV
jgi:transposase InsO family protein